MNIIANMILGQDEWEIKIPIGVFLTKEMGEHAVNNSSASLTVDSSGKPGINLTYHGNSVFLMDSDVQIKEMNDSTKERLGAPIDISHQKGKDKAIQSLISMDSAYVIDEDDFINSNKTLADFVKRYGPGYNLDGIAYQLEEIFIPISVDTSRH